MLELAGGIPLGVDVGDFFELEGAFHSDGVERAAARGIGHGACRRSAPRAYGPRIERQGLLEQRGQLDQPRDEAAFALGIRAVMFRESDHEQPERGELCGERLGRCDPDLGTRAGQHHEIGLADERAFGSIAYRERR